MNKYITEYLDSYIEELKKPEFAILLSGKWGSGKTHFIDTYIDNKKADEKIKFIKISLFGLYKTSEIDEQIYFAFHPIIGSKPVKVLSTILKGALKLNVPIDINGDGTSDVKSSLDIGKLFDLLGHEDKDSEVVFVFDDLERTSIAVERVLGYINVFVEQSDVKIIIIANEEELIKKEKEQYLSFKEKVIGKTFELHQNFDEVYISFLKSAHNSQYILKKNKEIVQKAYENVDFKNLRQLRQTILDFEYLYDAIARLDEKFKEHDIFIQELIYHFFVLSFIVKKGDIKEEKFSLNYYIPEILYTDESGLQDAGDKLDEEIREFKEKLAILEIDKPILGIDFYREYLFKSKLEDNNLKRAILETEYFYDEDTPSWIKLWHLLSIEDHEFFKLLADVANKFLKNEYIEHEDFLQVVAILLYLSEMGLYQKDKDEILKLAKKNIDSLMDEDYWKNNIYKYRMHGSKYSLGFINKDNSVEFKEILKYVEDKSQEAYNSDLKHKSIEVLDSMTDLELFNEMIYARYRDTPIFAYVNEKDFIDKLLNIEHKNMKMYHTISSLNERYQEHNLRDRPQLVEELKFWKTIDNTILSYIDKMRQPITYHTIEVDLKKELLISIIKNLENLAKE